MSDKNIEEKKREDTHKKNNKWTTPLIAGVTLLAIGAVIGSQYTKENDNAYPDKQIELQKFEDMNQLDVVVVDQGILTHNEGLKDFVSKHEGKLGLHLYTDEETDETYALISGEKGMEPLTIMLYGVVESNNKEVVVGYNFVEASPQFQDKIPTMLVRVEDGEGVNVTGRIVLNDDYEHYEEILERYKNGENVTDNTDVDIDEPIEDTTSEESIVDEETLSEISLEDESYDNEESTTEEDVEENLADEADEDETSSKYGGTPKVINSSKDSEEE